jgi:hypothetical protein
MLRFIESVLSDNASFYDAIRSELHDQAGVNVYSDEPIGSNFSCFDYNDEGDDRDLRSSTQEGDYRHYWKDCKLVMDDDGLYWESVNGKHAALLCYAILKAELKPKHVKLWVGPIDSSEEMGVVDFFTR